MLKQTKEQLEILYEAEIADWNIEKLEAKLKKYAKLVSDMDSIILDCSETLETAAKQEDLEQSVQLKKRINDAAANRGIFEIKVKAISVKLMQAKHEAAIELCGEEPKIPVGMDVTTFGIILNHIYEHTETYLIGDVHTAEGKTRTKQVESVIKANPTLKKYMKR